METKISTIQASCLEKPVSITYPLTFDAIQKGVQAWVSKQDKFWPSEITDAVLSNNLECIYVAYWILDASASGTWSAAIGIEKERTAPCSACGGSGLRYYHDINGKQATQTCWKCDGKRQEKIWFTEWFSQSGVAQGHLGGVVKDNIANDVSFHCGSRDYNARSVPLPTPCPPDIAIFQPRSTENFAGVELAKNLVASKVRSDANYNASQLGKVKDLQVAYVQVHKASASLWLYPIFVGDYIFDDQSHLIQIDGVTGQVYVEVPKRIRNQRLIEIAKWIVAVIAVIGVVVFVLYLFGIY